MSKDTLVIGVSNHAERYANMAVQQLQSEGHNVHCIGLREGHAHGVKIQTGFPELKNIHTVTLYIGPAHQPQYFEYITNLQPARLIFNPGTENPEFYRIADENGIAFETACTLVMLSAKLY